MDIDIDALVQQVREKSRSSIVQQCGTIRVLDMTQAIGLKDIYINVNILETPIGRRRMRITDLLQSFTPDNFERYGLGRVTQERVSGLRAVENYSKLIVLGKPGIGKTTFLKYLAIQCSLGEFQADKIAIFMTLKDFAEAENKTDILAHIIQLLQLCHVEENQTLELLKRGRTIMLLDGLDEVKEEDSQIVIQQIRDLSQNFPQNHFVITCRVAALEYTFTDFTEVEVADFQQEQIASFATKWFAAKDSVKGERFLQKLQENAPIKEIANNPLLLTLLCLAFEDSVDFPYSRSELYSEGINVLLKKWDASKNLERDRVYKKLSVQQKEDILSQIAWLTFEQGEYFFKQEKIKQYIANYILNLPDVTAESDDELHTDSNAVLKSIEMQHGLLVEQAVKIYSFSHLTFHEYFAAREVVVSSDPQALDLTIKKLVSHLTERRWREIFLLTVEMSRNSDYLLQLMKQKIDRLVADDQGLQALLVWADQKSRSVNASHKLVSMRAFYLALARILVLVSDAKLDLDHAITLSGDIVEIAFVLDLGFALASNSAPDLSVDRVLVLALAQALALTRSCKIEFGLMHSLIPKLDAEFLRSPLGEELLNLRAQLPNPDQDKENFKQWWQANGQAWIDNLRALLIVERNIGHNWNLSEQQIATLKQYYEANWLLLDCLNSVCYVTRRVRDEIGETLLLPSSRNLL